MAKSDLRNVLLKVILCVSFLLLCFLVLPVSAQALDASDLYENKPVQSGEPKYYVDKSTESYWVASDGAWHECIYDNANYDTVTAELRSTMYNREDHYSVYFMVDKKSSANSMETVFNTINKQVYNDDKTPYGGDYLEFMSVAHLNRNSGLINTTSESYSFYKMNVDIVNNTTKLEEDMISSYLERFNKVYIEDNETIKNSEGDERQYYIVKTIYNFIAKNTVYDMDVYEGTVGKDTEQYRYSHSAYGALFGNSDGAYNPEIFDVDKSMDLSYQIDSQGIYRINKRNQGRSVCDGYSLVFYYLCKLNGIDCQIVKGDYTDGARSDPHAWNMVYLKDFNDTDYTWYAVDVTFGCQKSKKLSDAFSIINYSYFLRGTDNKNYSPDNHQQLFDEYESIKQSESDYEFEISDINEDNFYTVVTRRRDADADKAYVDTGVYNLEDYMIIDPDGNCYKIDKNNENSFIPVEGFDFYGKGYYYSCEFYDFARGIEYTCEDQFILDAGTYYFDIITTRSNVIHKKAVVISPLDMSDWAEYDLESTRVPQQAGFIGNDILIEAKLFDNSGTLLVESKDYDMYCFLNSDVSKTNVSPRNPGAYTIKVVYKGNYTGFIEIPFTVNKADLANFGSSNINAAYGTDIERGLSSLKIGNTAIVSGTDYRIEVIGGLDYGNSGIIRIIGLAGSKYVQAGTVAEWTYKIDKRSDISSLFNNKLISNTKYQYTGKAVKPTDFKLALKDTATGKQITLVNGKDYKITSYSNNIKVGTATVNIEFIGNYTGKASMKFNIAYGKLSITGSNLTYNGKKQTAKATVKLGNVTLKSGTDYKISGNATNPGVYQGTITGVGAYSKVVSGKFIYYINPSAPSSVKTSTTQSYINVSWKKQGSSCIYEIWVYDTGKKCWKKVGQTSGASYRIKTVYLKGKKTAVKANTQYKIRVRAVIKGKVNGKAFTNNGPVKELTVRTNPKKLTCKVARKGSKNLRVTWNKDKTVTGYQVYLSTSKNFKKGVKGVTVKKNTNYAYTFKNLKKGKTYYVRIRSYKKVGNKTYYSAYSTIVKIKR